MNAVVHALDFDSICNVTVCMRMCAVETTAVVTTPPTPFEFRNKAKHTQLFAVGDARFTLIFGVRFGASEETCSLMYEAKQK